MQRRLQQTEGRGSERPAASRFWRRGRPNAIHSDLEAFRLAERVIRSSSRERPADGVLRSELRAQPRLEPGIAARVSKAVFAYYRWRGWLAEEKSTRAQIEVALALAERYALKPSSFTDAELSQRAVPAWLPDVMETPVAWIRSLQKEPRLWLRARPGRGRGLAAKLSGCRIFGEGPLSDVLEYQGEADLFRTAEFHAGEFEIQDISSQAVGFVCDPQPGEKWWDSCAGEGGKMLHLADLMENQGLIWASDRVAWRLAKLKRRAARAGVFNYRAVAWDGGARLPTKTPFDGVLLDAPCSGIGTWQRNPHARWTTTPEDVRDLGSVQQQLLINAAAGVKPGGKLLYAACTLTRLETVDVVKAFEGQCSRFRRLPLSNPMAPGLAPEETLTLWPQATGGNGMFVAAWVRGAD